MISMAKTPIIGITAEFLAHPAGSMGQGIQDAYVHAVESSGALPVLLPILTEGPAAASLMDRLDGILLSGGGDIAPMQYGDSPTCDLRAVDHDRDRFELDLARLALKRKMPLLGICRGLQVLNVACEGSLIQDISSQAESSIQHDTIRGVDGTHLVKLAPDSGLRDLLRVEQIQVNSAHHQAVDTLGQGLRTYAWSEDGIIEALEVIGHPFGIGVQWHPERMIHHPASQALLKALTSAAGRG
jgi:putative glutamine amidotransferase